MIGYTGLYKKGNKEADKPDIVWVLSPNGKEKAISVVSYLEKDAKPDIDDLPWQDDYFNN